ncbi:MAG: nucleotidyltransferase domain-containing protein [Desulfobacteraceae bacterium]|nr:nucleotidyltransferase domain-containing protein [Desulfobacteraceae bacterium]MDD3992847.1 nucleotidyltransferase domain-containing protein [Desulfobacteraceae bacterium]
MNQPILTPDRLRTLLAAFKERHGERYRLLKLGYFGSFAGNRFTVDSDVDIVFDTDSPNLFMTVMMKQDLEALLKRPVDVLQLRGLTNRRLKERIEKEAVYV